MNQEQLKRLVSYDPDTGLFTRLVGRKPGSVAGSIKPNGYVRINFGRGPLYAAHRLAWLYMTGSWPEHQIDHINRIRSDNRFANLRDVSKVENGLNTVVRSENTSGFTGVSWSKKRKKWRFELRVNGSRYHGVRDTALEAAAAYLEEKRKHTQVLGEIKETLFAANNQGFPAARGSQSVTDLEGQSTRTLVDGPLGAE